MHGETPWGQKQGEKPPRSHSKGGSIGRAWAIIYLMILGVTTWGLSTSLIGQLYTPLALAEPKNRSAHTPWCAGQLSALKVELEEAVLQEMARHQGSVELTRSERARRKTWSKRLATLKTLCQESRQLVEAGEKLTDLAARYDFLVDSLSETRGTLAQQVDRLLAESQHANQGS